jgi:F0F1-type ATP synthase assembly protein I
MEDEHTGPAIKVIITMFRLSLAKANLKQHFHGILYQAHLK